MKNTKKEDLIKIVDEMGIKAAQEILEEPGLFSTRFYRGKIKEIVKEEEGVKRKIIIGRTIDKKVLDEVDIEVFCALLKLWEEQGKPDDGKIYFYIEELLNALYIGKTEENIKMVQKCIEALFQLSVYINEDNALMISKLINSWSCHENKKDDIIFYKVSLNTKVIESIKLGHTIHFDSVPFSVREMMLKEAKKLLQEQGGQYEKQPKTNEGVSQE